jgi:hypothetical protein
VRKTDIRRTELMERFTITTSFGAPKGTTGQRFRGLSGLPEWADPGMREWLLRGQVMNVHGPDPWLAQITWEVDGGEARPVRFDVRGRDGQAIDPAQTFRKMATVIEDSRLQLGELYETTAHLWESHGHAKPAEQARDQAPKPKRGNATLPEDHFSLVANLYTMYRDDPAVLHPVKAVAAGLLKVKGYEKEAIGITDPALSEQRRTENFKSWLNRVNTWVNRAKKMGLIPGERNKENG